MSGSLNVIFNRLPAGRNYSAFIAASNTQERFKDLTEEVKVVYFSTDKLNDSDDDSARYLMLASLLALVL